MTRCCPERREVKSRLKSRLSPKRSRGCCVSAYSDLDTHHRFRITASRCTQPKSLSSTKKQDARTAGHWPDRPARPLTEPPRAQPLCEHDTRVSTGDTDSQSLVGALHSRVTATMPAQCIQCSTRQLTQPAMGGHVHGALKRKERHGHARPAHVQRGPTPCLLE